MKVLQINAVYGHSSTGTIVKLIQDFGKQNGIDSYVAYSFNGGQPIPNTYQIGSVIDHKLHALLSRIEGKQAYFSKGATKRFIKYLEELKPDIVHLHNLHSNYINLNLLLKYLAQKDIPTVITMHDCWYFTGGCFHYASVNCDRWQKSCGRCPKKLNDTPAYIRDASAEILRNRAKYLNAIPRLTIVGCSEWIAEQCKKSTLKDKEIIHIHNGFNFRIFQPVETTLKKKLGLEGKRVFIGPASKWLSEINKPTYKYFTDKLPKDAVLLLFGHPTPEQKSPDNVKFIGYVKNPSEMAELYSMADVFVNCSREDTLSSINIEAQACGTPVIAYDATGNKETIDPESGNAVVAGDYEALFEKAMEISSKNSESCISYVHKEFDPTVNYSKYIDLYKRIIDDPSI